MERYAIRSWWRSVNGGIGVIVVDTKGAAYLFWGGEFQIHCSGAAAYDRLGGLIARRATPLSSLPIGSYTPHELRHLISRGGSPVPH